MRIFTAGVGVPSGSYSMRISDAAIDAGARNFLFSFLEGGLPQAKKGLGTCPKAVLEHFLLRKAVHKDIYLFLDSGAFSLGPGHSKIFADRARERVSDYFTHEDVLEAYIAFIHEYGHLIDGYVNMDDTRDPLRTLRNQRILEGEGLSPIPVYHTRESIDRLKYYCENYSYIGIGGPTALFERAFVLAKKYNSDVKIHGFGVGTPRLILGYPWTSVDSTKWLMNGRYGMVFLWLSPTEYSRVTVSTDSPKLRSPNEIHYDNLGQAEKVFLGERLAELGYDIERARTDGIYRRQANIAFYVSMENKINSGIILPRGETTCQFLEL
jgi:hypothetical protein